MISQTATNGARADISADDVEAVWNLFNTFPVMRAGFVSVPGLSHAQVRAVFDQLVNDKRIKLVPGSDESYWKTAEGGDDVHQSR